MYFNFRISVLTYCYEIVHVTYFGCIFSKVAQAIRNINVKEKFTFRYIGSSQWRENAFTIRDLLLLLFWQIAIGNNW